VEEVFKLMLGVDCRRDLAPVDQHDKEPESVTAVVGFGGCSAGLASSDPAARLPWRSPRI